MKNLKKILALAVAFVMCFTMFAGAAVFSDVTPGGDYSQAITFLSDLGVIAGKPDGSFGINDAITRADAACLIARLMTGQPNPPKNDGTVQFSDVPSGSYYETSVGYCVALGITVGTGNGQYSPLRTITDGEFIAMLTRALGYDTAEHPLAFPMGNITTAQARGLLYGVNVDYASDALRGEDAQMLYNAMFAEYDKAASNKNTFQGADDHWDVTIAEEVFGLGRLSHDTNWRNDNSGIDRQGTEVSFHGANRNNNPAMSCDAHTWVIAGVDARYNDNTYIAFAIDDADVKAVDPEDKAWAYQEFTYDGDIKDVLGYRVELWGEYDHSGAPWDVAAIKVVDGNMNGSRAAASAFQSRYDANQSVYKYTPDMYTDNDKVVVDGKTLYIQADNNQVNTGKINLDIDTAADWMWKTEPTKQSITSGAYAGFDNTFASDGIYTNRADAYRLADVTATTNRNPLSNRQVNLNFADGDQYTLFDWDSDDYIDFVITDTAKYAEVVTKTSSRMVLEADDRNINASTGARTRGQYSLKLDDDNLKVEGADAIEEGDIVEITVVSRVHTRGDGEIVTINLKAVEPEVKKLEKVNITRGEYTFDGEVIDLANMDLFDVVELQQDGSQSREELDTTENIGKEFNLWFDRNGFLIKARVNDDSAMGYLMILEVDDGQDNLHTSVSVKRRNLAVADVLFDDNTVGKEVEFVKNLTIDGSSSENGYNSSNRSWNQQMVVGNVYKYYMNDDKQITRLVSMTDIQAADYNFDDSKDRLGINAQAGNGQRNYGFADKAVMFAAKPVQTVVNTGVEDNGGAIFGYIRSKNFNNLSASTSLNAEHFWVDPADVMAVSIDDIPEIDNRITGATTLTGATDTTGTRTHAVYNWRTSSTEVTHPARFISWDWYNNFSANANPDATRWMEYVTESGWNNGDHVYNPVIAAATGRTVPSVAFSTNRDGEIEAGVIGVDSLNFFGATSIKLALISNVYAVGGKSYEFRAAIDGKYDTFKTISADEDEIFKGTLGDSTPNSFNAMRTYLNQSSDSYTGKRNALYAEVVLNSEGLIREVRAMRVVNPKTNTDTYWGNDLTKTQFLEGNVYRVIRGVTTQLLSKNLVTWQASPTASSGSTLYALSKYDDNNGYDHMEAFYDDDTKFYYIDQNVPMFEDVRTLIGHGFREDIDGDISAKDSGVLAESVFADGNRNATYYFADYAVYKNDMDRLAAVFAFDNDGVTNSGTVGAAGLFKPAKGQSLDWANHAVTNGNSAAVPTNYVITIDTVKGNQGAGNDPLRFTLEGEGYNTTTDGTSAAGSPWTPNAAARAIRNAINAIAGTPYVATLSATSNNTVIVTKTAPAGAEDFSFNFDAKDNFTVSTSKNVGRPSEKVDPEVASSTITVTAGNYSIDNAGAGVTITLNFTHGNLAALSGKSFVINDGNYSATDIANIMADEIEKLASDNNVKVDVDVDRNTVTIFDRTGIPYTDGTVANDSMGLSLT